MQFLFVLKIKTEDTVFPPFNLKLKTIEANVLSLATCEKMLKKKEEIQSLHFNFKKFLSRGCLQIHGRNCKER